eukprot:4436398-Amphidinium_carterae.1
MQVAEKRLPARLQFVAKLGDFSVCQNRLRGPLPEVGLQSLGRGLKAMTHLGVLYAQRADLTGRLPEEGFKAKHVLQMLDLSSNRLAGSLPEEGMKDHPLLTY